MTKEVRDILSLQSAFIKQVSIQDVSDVKTYEWSKDANDYEADDQLDKPD